LAGGVIASTLLFPLGFRKNDLSSDSESKTEREIETIDGPHQCGQISGKCLKTNRIEQAGWRLPDAEDQFFAWVVTV